MSRSPKVDQLVLYKHGMAFVGRRGPVDGDFTLTFRRDDMKDVLKSLIVDAAGGASVGVVSFDTPADPRTELADRGLLLDPGAALADLLEALRGRTVAVHCGGSTRRGEVIGLDGSADPAGRRLLVLRTDSGEIGLIDLGEAQGFDVLDPASNDDLDYLIDRSRAATSGRNCDIGVQITGVAADVRVSYVVAAPMWRVSYRVIRDGDSATLVATAIIHNPLDEDLADVAVTLTTGQPISFDIDLYHSRQVDRVVVAESVRTAGPRRGHKMIEAAPSMLDDMSVGAGYESAVEDVETADRGEYFEYRIATPVSLKRGGAAMIPIAAAPVDGVRRELRWRDDRGSAPDVMLAFTNTSGVVLEEGPAVVYEDGGYAGEAMLGFTSRGADVRLAFAKDLAVRCRRAMTTRTVATRIVLTDDALIEERRYERHHTLHAENDHDYPVDVIFELPVSHGHAVVVQDGAVDAGREDEWARFAVTVPANQTAAATVLESWPISSEIYYDDLEPGRLEQWLADRTLDVQTMRSLAQVLEHRNAARRLAEQGERVGDQREEVYAAQGRIADQLRVLGTEGAEGELRARQVGELATLQARVSALDAEVRRLREQADTERQWAADELRRLVGAGSSS